MSRKPCRQCHAPQDEGVSTVLGAILMFGLLVITLVTIQTQFVPVWDKQRELDASRQVAIQFATIKSDFDRLTGNQTSLPISDPLSLSRDQGFSFFQTRLPPGVATFTPTVSNGGMTMSTARTFLLQQSGGQSLYSLGESWTWDGTQITGVTNIVHVRIRVPAPAGLPSAPLTPLSLIINDRNGNCAAKILVYAEGAASSKTMDARLYAALTPTPGLSCQANAYETRPTLYAASASYGTPPGAPTFYYFDALGPGGGFDQALGAIPRALYPLTMVGDQGSMGGVMGNAGAADTGISIVYDQSTQYGTVRVGGTGQTFSTFQQVIPSGSLSVTVPNTRLPSQAYVMEYGAVFLDQPDGSAMVIPPNFAVSTALSQGSIAWTFPALSGGSSAVTGVRSATVVASPTSTQTFLQATAQDLTFTITTNHGAAWKSFWDQKMSLAGLSSSNVLSKAPCADTTTAAPQFTSSFDVNAGTATLIFFGPCSAPNSGDQDITLAFQEASVGVDLRPAG